MSHKKEIEEPNLGTEEAKELELKEQPKPHERLVILLHQYQIRMNQAHMIEEKA